MHHYIYSTCEIKLEILLVNVMNDLKINILWSSGIDVMMHFAREMMTTQRFKAYGNVLERDQF